MKHVNNIKIIKDMNNKDIVLIQDIRFRGKKIIKGKEIENFLKIYIGKAYLAKESSDLIYIGKDFPNEYARSKYTYGLNKSMAKTKANATRAIPELIEIANNKKFTKNTKDKHNKDAMFGWYRYETRFALPVYDNDKNIDHYKIFKAHLLIKSSEDGKLYLYDMIDIKDK